MKEIVKEEIETREYDENDHIIDMEMWEPFEFNIDENYEYIKKGKIFEWYSNMLYYGVAMPVLYVLTKILYDLKIEGKENLQNLETGAVSVSNHVLFLDCAMVGLALEDKKVYYTTLEDSFKIPIVRKLIKLLRAVPIPKEKRNKLNFMQEIDKALQNGDIIHFYPEASLWPYYNKIRNFKTGAFHFAVKNNVPIIPMVISFRRPIGLRRVFKHKSDVTLKILKPMKYEGESIEQKAQIEELKESVQNIMQKSLKK